MGYTRYTPMMASLIGEMMSNGEPVSGIRGSHSTPQRYCTWLLFGQEQRWRFFAAVAACTNQAHWVRRSCGRCCLAFHLKIGMELMIRLLAAHSSLAWSNQRKSSGECNSATSRSSGGLPVCVYIYTKTGSWPTKLGLSPTKAGIWMVLI